ncbi:hypothetical protein AKJ40_01145 [candidate division MSBL1 archaeon SCGC-AAA259M10]|uniref:Transporter n=1 Tax=candidate division MSBL1 archaeon SCGC-AAA259M10 TaxID=1698270 RepID=A0A133V2A6_9EURY|nr:hypothetical protein AKJ40_01145 [candidate division MSBL1 archaeon SCGC-AAA259M10]
MIGRIIFVIFALLGAGFVSRKVSLLTSGRVDILNKLAFYVALPALVFHSIYRLSLGEIFSPLLVMGFLIVVFSTSGLGWFTFRKVESAPKKSISIVQSYHGNLGYMGLPIVTFALGEIGGAKASFLLGFSTIVQILLTVSLLVNMNQIGGELRGEIKKVAFNPVLLALVTGLLFSYLNISIWTGVEEIISLIGKAALPLALIGVGASIELKGWSEDLKTISSVTFLKIVFMPILGFVILTGLGVETISLKTGVLMLAMPPAASTYIYASELGGDKRLASLNISITTIASLLTLSVLLVLLA